MTNGVGRYQMALSAVLDKTDATYWYVLVWDTESGRSKFYYGSTKIGIKAANSGYNLPSNPL